jgi:hypothetical protein
MGGYKRGSCKSNEEDLGKHICGGEVGLKGLM